VIVDLQAQSDISEEFILSKSKNSPWLGHSLSGKIISTFMDGQISWQESE